MGLKQQIDNDIKTAMLNKQKEELLALRAVKSMILLAETEKGRSGALDKEAEDKLLMKAAKQRKESAEIFKKEGREDLYKKEAFELEIISRYLPKQLSAEEINAIVEEFYDLC
ncbi:MAG TPA: GatB/YqeY domain-containing protein, partial [Cyclobacteriaceae bacterium]|nr:GatB/YqeY domain-containing protein [Cyclobacteriaceae bacterium]